MLQRTGTGRIAVALAIGMALTLLPTVGGSAVAGERVPITTNCVEVTDTLDLAPNDAYGMTVHPTTGDLYVAVDGEGRVEVIDGDTDAVIDSIPVPDPGVNFLQIDAAHDTLWVSSYSADSVFAIDISTETLVGTVAVPSAQSLALNRTTNRLYAAGQSNAVTVINTLTRAAVGTLPVGGSSLGLAVDSATNRIFVGDFTNDTLDVFGGADNLLDDSWALPGSDPITVAFDKTTGSVWVTTRAPGDVSQVDPDDGAIGTTFPLAAAQGLDLNPSLGQGYVTPSGGSTLTAFNLADGSTVDVFPVGTDALVVEAKVDPLRIYASGLGDGTVTVIGPSTGPFTDVSGSHPFCFDIDWLVIAGIADGFPDGTYRPVTPVSRQAMAAFLYRFAGEPLFNPPGTPTFPDVPLGHPFRKEIEWLAASGITGGFSDGTFRPASAVTRQSMAAFLHRYSFNQV